MMSSEIWSIGSVEQPGSEDAAASRMLRWGFFYSGVATLLSWQVLLCPERSLSFIFHSFSMILGL